MLIEEQLPDYDATRIEHRVVSGDPEAVFAVARDVDFLRAWHESRAVTALFAARGLAERAVSALLRRDLPQPETPATMRLADLSTDGEWVLLGQDPPHEIAFGAVGRFWGGETGWERIQAADFRRFDGPGRAKIACNLSLRQYGRDQTLVSYEARTRGTDRASARAFLRYWRVVSPGVGIVMRSLLSVIENDAAERAKSLR